MNLVAMMESWQVIANTFFAKYTRFCLEQGVFGNIISIFTQNVFQFAPYRAVRLQWKGLALLPMGERKAIAKHAALVSVHSKIVYLGSGYLRILPL